ncbi:hypoxia-inducible lipid droplet-associated protein [Ochotona princeps]|uniref:hypoxia-inducible lipid droplet-associated protein n=1 Tax=Ochotona princeps TaxID=9978 RepID=UPI0001775C1B|nr:hypoxia-inducible lipid droplet-associated protein [Ochotona princeps]
MKQMVNLYLLGMVLTLLSVFVRVMESLESLLESPAPGNSWNPRGQLTGPESPRGLPDHPPRGMR